MQNPCDVIDDLKELAEHCDSTTKYSSECKEARTLLQRLQANEACLGYKLKQFDKKNRGTITTLKDVAAEALVFEDPKIK